MQKELITHGRYCLPKMFENGYAQIVMISVNIWLPSLKSHGVFALIFFTYLPESQIQKNILFIQTNPFIIFTCPNSALLVPGIGQVG